MSDDPTQPKRAPLFMLGLVLLAGLAGSEMFQRHQAQARAIADLSAAIDGLFTRWAWEEDRAEERQAVWDRLVALRGDSRSPEEARLAAEVREALGSEGWRTRERGLLPERAKAWCAAVGSGPAHALGLQLIVRLEAEDRAWWSEKHQTSLMLEALSRPVPAAAGQWVVNRTSKRGPDGAQVVTFQRQVLVEEGGRLLLFVQPLDDDGQTPLAKARWVGEELQEAFERMLDWSPQSASYDQFQRGEAEFVEVPFGARTVRCAKVDLGHLVTYYYSSEAGLPPALAYRMGEDRFENGQPIEATWVVDGGSGGAPLPFGD